MGRAPQPSAWSFAGPWENLPLLCGAYSPGLNGPREESKDLHVALSVLAGNRPARQETQTLATSSLDRPLTTCIKPQGGVEMEAQLKTAVALMVRI